MARHAAFLRGINIGERRVKMDELQKAFESLGFVDVKTTIASGNVVFTTRVQSGKALRTKIEQKLRTQFGFDIGVTLRSLADLQAFVGASPFREVRVTPKTKLYVTFLAHRPQTALTTPYKSRDKDFTIISVSDSEICSADPFPRHRDHRSYDIPREAIRQRHHHEKLEHDTETTSLIFSLISA